MRSVIGVQQNQFLITNSATVCHVALCYAVQVCLEMEALHPDSFKPQLPPGFESAATVFHRCACLVKPMCLVLAFTLPQLQGMASIQSTAWPNEQVAAAALRHCLYRIRSLPCPAVRPHVWCCVSAAGRLCVVCSSTTLSLLLLTGQRRLARTTDI